MRCRTCHQNAAFNMRHHKLALCQDHYLEWFVAQTLKTIERYKMFGRDSKVLVAVSGGKDSLALWDVLLQSGYRADGLYIGQGIDGGIGYSDLSRQKVDAFVEQYPEVKLHVVDVDQVYGQTIPQIADQHRASKPCSACGLVKRHIMNRVTLEAGYDCLVTGHNLDDEAAVLFLNTLRWQTQYLSRQSPVLEATHPGLARKAKPFCRFYERETAAYAIMRGLDYMYAECPYAEGSTTITYKNLLNELEDAQPGAKLHFYLSFLSARNAGFLDVATEDVVLHSCENCGQPTTSPGLCAFCRLWQNRPLIPVMEDVRQ